MRELKLKFCLKCGASFPNHAVVDGIVRNLQRRKYCLECSPWGKHNTAPLHVDDAVKSGIRSCRICGRLTSRRRPLCSSCCTKIRRIRAKLAAIAYLGGKCKQCGFTGHPAAFDFHHRDPATKSFSIGNAANIRWTRLVQELDKCDLLCRNCHSIIHSNRNDQEWLTEAAKYNGTTFTVTNWPMLADSSTLR